MPASSARTLPHQVRSLSRSGRPQSHVRLDDFAEAPLAARTHRAAGSITAKDMQPTSFLGYQSTHSKTTSAQPRLSSRLPTDFALNAANSLQRPTLTNGPSGISNQLDHSGWLSGTRLVECWEKTGATRAPSSRSARRCVGRTVLAQHPKAARTLDLLILFVSQRVRLGPAARGVTEQMAALGNSGASSAVVTCAVSRLGLRVRACRASSGGDASDARRQAAKPSATTSRDGGIP